MPSRNGTALLRQPDRTLAQRLAESAQAVDGIATPTPEVHRWIAERSARQLHQVRCIPFEDLRRWRFQDESGNLVHDSGRFFSVEGLHVQTDAGPVREWCQPIINQPEIGILGILVKQIDGVLHCLMQTKAEPGNVNGVQLSPTVQATRSNYTRVHRGAAVPYLEHFLDARPETVLADVLQSEQGSWFYRKRNRNMVVEVTEDVEPGEDFRWLTLGQLHELLRIDNLVNMDARTVLSCVPGGVGGTVADAPSELAAAIARSSDGTAGGLHTSVEVMSWITARQSSHLVRTRTIPLGSVTGWTRSDRAISHERGGFFSVVAVEVSTDSREVASWTQPLIEPHHVGVIALLVKRVDGVLHALVNARVEPGYLNVVELAPTVQCTPENYAWLPASQQPPFLDLVRHGTSPDRVLFDCELSEEGGRFRHARSRYQIIEVEADFPDEGLGDFRWLTLHQLNDLLRHSHYVNVQARSLVACLRGLR